MNKPSPNQALQRMLRSCHNPCFRMASAISASSLSLRSLGVATRIVKTKAILSLIFSTALFCASCSTASQPPSSTETPRPTLAAFSALPRDITFPELVRRVGESHDDTGSGIYIYRYHLSDGTAVLVGTPDRKRIFYITHVSGAVGTRLFPSTK